MTANTNTSRVIFPRTGRSIPFPLHETRAVVNRGDLPSEITMFDFALEARTPGTPPHKHTHEDEIYVIYEGEMTFYLDGTVQQVGAGGAVSLPRGGWHAWWNEGDQPVRAMCVVSHATEFDTFFDEVVTRLAAAGNATPTVVMETVGSTSAEYGLEIDMSQLPERAHGIYGL